MGKAGELRTVPNNTQAYVIQPSGDARLVLAALHPKGVYYAAQTLRQLLDRGIAKETVTVPLVAALGLGLADAVPGRSPLLDGFGLIAFASLSPMIFVLGWGLLR